VPGRYDGGEGAVGAAGRQGTGFGGCDEGTSWSLAEGGMSENGEGPLDLGWRAEE